MNRFRSLPIAPAEGWLTVGLVALTVLTFAWSIDAAAWILRNGELTDFLSGAAFLSVVYGFLAAKSGWPRWTAHAVGAVFAALIVPLMIGGTLAPNQPLGAQYEATAGATVQAYLDLAVRGKLVTPQYGHFMLVLGLLVWATGQFAAYATFGHRRALSALTVIGLLLLANMSATFQDHMWYLVVYSLAALLLLVRLHAFDEQSAWLRRRIGDPAAVGGIYLRGGTAFVAATVLAALFLTGTAKSAPLAGAWGGVDQRLIEFGQQFQGLLQSWGGTRISGVSFGPSTDISGIWQQERTPALEIRLPPGDTEKYYWRIYTYDTYSLPGSWALSPTDDAARGANEPLLEGMVDEPLEVQTKELTYSVTPLQYGDEEVVGPKTVVSVSVPTLQRTLGPGGFFGTVALSGGKGSYSATAKVALDGEEQGELNKGALRGAGTDYPPGLFERYTQVPAGTLGPESEKLLAEILAAAPSSTAFDLADTMKSRFFHDGQRFIYDPNILDIDCQGRSTVECFAWSRRGACMHYATSMILLLRSLDIPARLAMGFLPGERDRTSGVETVMLSDSHAWVEVYFPGYGWVQFDPTGGGVSEEAGLPAGVDPSVRPSGSRPDPGASDDILRSVVPSVPAPGGSQSTSATSAGAAPFIAITVLLAITVGALAFLAYRRGPRQSQPESIYSGIVRIASRLGFAPRPAQTVYEYTGALGDELPTARPALSTVARAKVEVAYGHGEIAGDRLRALIEAQRRLRVQLLRLLIRRRNRRR